MFEWFSRFTDKLFRQRGDKSEDLDSFSRICLYVL